MRSVDTEIAPGGIVPVTALDRCTVVSRYVRIRSPVLTCFSKHRRVKEESATGLNSMNTIDQAFHGEDVFLTGATGMLGTALLLKITKDTGIRRIYVLVRGGEGEYRAYLHINQVMLTFV